MSGCALPWLFLTATQWCTLKQTVHAHGPHNADETQKELCGTDTFPEYYEALCVFFMLWQVLLVSTMYLHCNQSVLNRVAIE